MLTVLLSTLFQSNTSVLAGTGAALLAAYLIHLFPGTKIYSPFMLTDAALLKAGSLSDYGASFAVTGLLCVVFAGGGVLLFQKRQI